MKELKEKGLNRFKVKVGLGLERDYERCKLIRECIGPDATMMMDANQVWSVEEAIQTMKKLADFKPLWIEEPTSPDDVIGHKKIKDAIAPLGIGVATGEHAQNRILHKHFLKMGAYTFCQPDPCRLGGLNELLLVILMAKKFNTPVCMHSGGVGLCEMGLHATVFDYIGISASLENRMFEHSGALHEHFFHPIELKAGRYVLPKGLGYTIDMKPESISQFTFPHGGYWGSKRT